MKRQALGKGLSSLIPEPPVKPDAGVLMLDIDRIHPSRMQPRQDFSGLEGMVSSIRETGIIQPVVVRKEEDGYGLVAGERRWRAAQLAGLHRIPAVVREVADDRLLEIGLIENIQRKELNPIEEARAYEVLTGKMNLTQADVARRVGRDRSSIANSLRILKLPESIQQKVREGILSFGHAKALLALSDAATQIKVANDVVAGFLSVRETEERVSRILRKSPRDGARSRPRGPDDRDPNVKAAEEHLCRALATKVRIVKRGDRGRLEIEFYSGAELERLYHALLSAERGH